MKRPSFSAAWNAFMSVRLPIADVGKVIGGKVQENIEMPVGGFQNACPIRMSYVLNRTGFPISKSSRYAMVSGGDSNQYIFRVADFISYLEQSFGKADIETRTPRHSAFAKSKGIIAIKGHGWGNASGHITLWNGSICSDSCHLLSDPDNGSFVPTAGLLWKLP